MPRPDDELRKRGTNTGGGTPNPARALSQE